MIHSLALAFLQLLQQVPTTPGEPSALAWVDVDGDGRLDLAVVHGDGTLQLLRNAGQGRFEDATEDLGLAAITNVGLCAWADYDGDGRMDVFVGARTGRSLLLHNEGNQLVDMSAGSGLACTEPVLGAYWLDSDADGRLDLCVGTVGEKGLATTLYRGFEGGFFEASPLPAPVPAVSWSGALPTAPPDAAGGAGDRGGAGDGRPFLLPGNARTPTIQVGPVAGPTPTTPFALACTSTVRDGASPSSCLSASSTPTIGDLYPLSTHLAVTPSGNVGMGTTSPLTKLHVRRGAAGATPDANSAITAENGTHCYVSILSPDSAERGVLFGEPSGNATGALLYNTPTVPDGFAFRTNGGAFRMGLDASGRLGLGTSTPLARFDVVGGADGDGGNDPVGLAFEHRLGGYRHFVRTRHDAALGSLNNTIEFFVNNSLSAAGSSAPGVGNVGAVTINASLANRLQVSGGIEVDSAAVSSGTSTGPMLRFGEPTSGEGILSKRTAGGNQWGLELMTGGASRMAITNGGNVGIGTSAPTDRLHVVGSTRTTCITITGGCDVAEPFDLVGEGLEPGMLVTIDPEREGTLRLTGRAYDTAVAGVISGAGGVRPGVTLKQEGALDTGELVALAGRVYCWCDAANGAIRPGDLLTSSDVPGHAMRASDRERASGAIVGKALSALPAGRGLVLIVVSLQ